jgi:hypothetical protein
VLVLLVAMVSGCRCTWCAPSAELDRQVGKHAVKVEGESAHRWGIDGIGAPHVGGIIWPTLEGAGFVIRLVVDDRPTVHVGGGSFMPTKKRLKEMLAAVELEGSPDEAHIAVRVPPDTDWRVLHLLPRGVPFDAASVPAVVAVDWTKVPEPLAVASTELRDARCHQAKACELVWDAVGDQPGGSPLDDVVLEVWPAAPKGLRIVVERAKPGSGATEPWRQATATKTLAAVEKADARKEAVTVLVALQDLPALARLDRRLVDLWKADPDENEINQLLNDRLEATDAAVAMGSQERAHAAATARALITTAALTDRAANVVVLAGTPEDVAWMDDALLPLWPQNAQTAYTKDHVHDVLEKRAETPDRVPRWGPPPSPAWVERATDRAAQTAKREEMQTKAARLLLALATPRALDIALDVMLERWPDKDPYESSTLEKAAPRGSAAWKGRAVAKANACIDEAYAAAAQLAPYKFLPDAQGARAGRCVDLLVVLEGDQVSCPRWAEIERIGKHTLLGTPARAPARCSADAGAR